MHQKTGSHKTTSRIHASDIDNASNKAFSPFCFHQRAPLPAQPVLCTRPCRFGQCTKPLKVRPLRVNLGAGRLPSAAPDGAAPPSSAHPTASFRFSRGGCLWPRAENAHASFFEQPVQTCNPSTIVPLRLLCHAGSAPDRGQSRRRIRLRRFSMAASGRIVRMNPWESL